MTRSLVCLEQVPSWAAAVQPGKEQTALWRLLPADSGYVKLAPAAAPGLRLDLTNPEQKPVLRSDQNASGQLWMLQQVEEGPPERHRLSSMWTGPEKVLAAVAAGEVALRGLESVFGNQSWRIQEARPLIVEPEPGAVPHQEVDADDGETPTCRICFDTVDGPGNNRLFSPCRCRGSMRYVHVGCLNQWRCSAANSMAHYRCDSCHYEYRVQRTQLAQLMLSSRAPVCLVAAAFLSAAALLGLVASLAFPQLHANLPGLLLGALHIHVPVPEEAGGNMLLWTLLKVLNAPVWQRAAAHAATAALARIAFSGVLALAVPGFLLYIWQELRRPEGGFRIDQHGAMLIASLASFTSPQLGRFAIAIGMAMSLRALYANAHAFSKHVAQLAGERILAVA